MLTLGVTKAETGVRSAAAPLEIAEREGAGTSKEHAGKESGSRCIPGVRDWSTIQQRVRPPWSSLRLLPGTKLWDSRRTKLEKLQTDVLELASRLDVSLSRPPTLQGS